MVQQEEHVNSIHWNQWVEQTKSYHLTIKDILNLNEGESIHCNVFR